MIYPGPRSQVCPKSQAKPFGVPWQRFLSQEHAKIAKIRILPFQPILALVPGRDSAAAPALEEPSQHLLGSFAQSTPGCWWGVLAPAEVLLGCGMASGHCWDTAHIPHPVPLQSNGKERSSQRDPQVTRRSHSRGAFSGTGLSYSQTLSGAEVLLPVLHITEQGSSLSPACPCAPVLSLGTGDSSHLLPGARGICSFPILTSFPRCAHSPGPSAIPCPLSPRPGPAAAEMEVSSEGKHGALARRGC